MSRVPDCVRALLTDDEMEAFREKVKDFLATDGPVLQKLLIEYEEKGVEESGLGSYVEEFWNDSYLAPDSSVVMNLNPFFVLEDGPDTNKQGQTKRAASLAFSAIKIASALRKEELVPDTMRGTPLCMDQFRALFGACRVPDQENDTIAVDTESNHVLVIENNQMYFFQALWPDGTVCVNEADIVEILIAIKADAGQTPASVSSNSALGVLTTLPRKEWAAVRTSIVGHSESNATSLDIVDRALFVLVIDDVTPEDMASCAANMLHGTYKLKSGDNDLVDQQVGSLTNRWYDKLQLIVCADGRAGVNFEHSSIDGHTALRLVSDIFSDNIISFAKEITKTIYGGTKFPPLINAEVRPASLKDPDLVQPRKLSFDLPKHVLDQIYFAETSLSDQISASETFVLEFKGFGKALIVHNKMSPDSLVQIAMQLAHFRLYGKIVSQYEPVLTKAFYHGRTEAMRTATAEAAAFCKLWLQPDATEDSKLQALRVATQVHSAGIKRAATGKGIERHLFALQKIGHKNGLPTPEFFNSKGISKLNHTILSTSNCGNQSLRLFGFGPVVADGLGIGYIIRDSGLQFSISSKQRQTERFANTLKQTLIDIQAMLQPLLSVQVSHSHTTDEMAKAETDVGEYCEGYGDTYGETLPVSVPPTAGIHKKTDQNLNFSIPDSDQSRAKSVTFARVMKRRSSLSARQMRMFGKSVSTRDIQAEIQDDLEESDLG